MLQQPPRPEPQLPPVVLVVTFKQFQSVKPPKFEGTVDPTKARAWLKEMEKAFALVKVELDLKKYFPRYMKNQMEIKFLELKEGNMSVTEYEAKFTELSRFVPEQVDMEEKRAKRFQQGLQSWIRSRVAVFKLTTYTTVVQNAMIIEGESVMSQKEKGPGNFQNRSNRKPGFQARTNMNFKRTGQGNQRTAGRKKVTYFQCGRKWHVARDCRGPAMTVSVPNVLALPPSPQYNQPIARTFNITMKETVQSHGV
ncbi:uncharacterized protein LOC141660242 [Apium graveolens]|uniref:uncharacterized protein LOC141660242 n=1 Tax=Apium graveolens TaxID=4045 RepID=UPI003D78BEF9